MRYLVLISFLAILFACQQEAPKEKKQTIKVFGEKDFLLPDRYSLAYFIGLDKAQADQLLMDSGYVVTNRTEKLTMYKKQSMENKYQMITFTPGSVTFFWYNKVDYLSCLDDLLGRLGKPDLSVGDRNYYHIVEGDNKFMVGIMRKGIPTTEEQGKNVIIEEAQVFTMEAFETVKNRLQY